MINFADTFSVQLWQHLCLLNHSMLIQLTAFLKGSSSTRTTMLSLL